MQGSKVHLSWLNSIIPIVTVQLIKYLYSKLYNTLQLQYVNSTGLILKWPLYQYIPTSKFLGFSSHDNMGMISSSPSAPATPHSDCAQSLGRAPRQCHPPIHETPASDFKKKSDLRESQRRTGATNKNMTKKDEQKHEENTPTLDKIEFFQYFCVCMSYCIPLYLRRPPTFDIHYASSKHPYKSLAGIDLGFSLALVSYRLTMSYVHYFTVFETVVNHLTHWTMLQPNVCVNDIYQEMQITNRQTWISHCSCIMRHQHAPFIIILIFIIITNHHKSSPSSPTSSHHHDHEWSSCIIRHSRSLSIIMHLTNDVSPRFSGIPILDARCTLDASTPPVVVWIWRAIRSSVCWCWALNEGPLDN